MKTGKKITVALAAALVVAIFAAGAAVSMVGAQGEVTEDLDFTVTVSTPPLDVRIEIRETDFGDMSAGEEKEIESVDVTNSGDVNATMEAKFSTEDSGVYGFTGGSVISANNFWLDGIALDPTGEAEEVCSLPAPVGGLVVVQLIRAKLFVPIGQPDAVYNGTVELIFSAA
jgi:hypothetical protein